MSEIRRACADDLEGVKALLMQVLAVHHEGRPDLFKAIGQKYSDDELLQIFADDNNPVFVMVDNDKVLAEVSLNPLKPQFDHVFLHGHE